MEVVQAMHRCAQCPHETETCKKLVFDDVQFCIEPKYETIPVSPW